MISRSACSGCIFVLAKDLPRPVAFLEFVLYSFQWLCRMAGMLLELLEVAASQPKRFD